MISKNRQDIIARILSSRRVLVTGHRSPDGDSIGSQLALGGLLAARGIDHLIVNEGAIPGKYRFLPGIDRILEPRQVSTVAGGFDTTAVIECSNLDRIGAVRPLIDEACIIINIDHHQDNVPFGHLNLKDVGASAAGEMLYDLCREGDLSVTADMAVNLYTAILTDTGRFHYSNTTPHCLRVAADLVELGADPTRITNEVYYRQPRDVVRLQGVVSANMQYLLDGRLCLMTLDRRLLAENCVGEGDTEGMINATLAARGVEVGVLFTEVSDSVTKVSFRSQAGVDVAAVAAHYGGGGHVSASGCMVPLPLEKAKNAVVAYLEDKLNGSL